MITAQQPAPRNVPPATMQFRAPAPPSAVGRPQPSRQTATAPGPASEVRFTNYQPDVQTPGNGRVPFSQPPSLTGTTGQFVPPGTGAKTDPLPPRTLADGMNQLAVPVPLNRPAQPSAKSSLELPPPPGGETIRLPLPPLEPGDLRFPINLATALRLSDGRPLIVAAAQASVWSAEGQLQKAKVLWVPSFMLAANYARHDGPIDFNQGLNVPPGVGIYGQPAPGGFGKPLNESYNWFTAGVSLYQVVATTDVIFQPLASRQVLDAKRWDIQTAKNDVLLEVSRAYFNVHRFRGQYAGAIYTVEQGRKLIAAIDALRRDLVPAVELDRARNLLAFLEQQAVSSRENWRLASADLTQILRLDPRAVCEPLEQDHLQVTLIDAARPLDELIPIGLRNRPELAANKAEIEAAAVRIRQEKMRPILPSVLITGFQTPGGMVPQASIFGTGHGSQMNNWGFRDDVSAQLVWQWNSFGLGNMALVKKRRGEQSQAIVKLAQAQDAVAAEITQTQAQVQSAAARVVQAERSLRTGLITYQKNYEGLGQTRRFENMLELVYRPQEVVYALKLLNVAFDEYFNTVADYNTAQFMFFHALGYPAREIAYFRPPGEILPVNTDRPSYLPPVGAGPPHPPR
ncbi:MAG TPA: TolC family protein [Pirellulales bacterium]|nr:TolC family protein [Pirellulales bacterium]